MNGYYFPVLTLVFSITVSAQAVKTILVGNNLVAEGIVTLPASIAEDAKHLTGAGQMKERIKKNDGSGWFRMANDEGNGFTRRNNADFQFYATVHFIKYSLFT
jgi:hypothetical protein